MPCSVVPFAELKCESRRARASVGWSTGIMNGVCGEDVRSEKYLERKKVVVEAWEAY